MIVLYVADPLNPADAEKSVRSERIAARRYGLQSRLLDMDHLIYNNDVTEAVKRIPVQRRWRTGIYRGWMLRPFHYQAIYNALLEKKIKLLNSPTEYEICTYLPASYPFIAEHTPRTVWTKDLKNFGLVLQPFGSASIVVRDYFQTCKYQWNSACFIKDASCKPLVNKIVSRFLELRGDNLQGGLVFREFLEFEPIHRYFPDGKLDLCAEYRLIFFNQHCFWTKYWGEQARFDNPPIHRFQKIAATIPSQFFAMDVAKMKGSNEWKIIELTDGQIVDIPDHAVSQFYYFVQRVIS